MARHGWAGSIGQLVIMYGMIVVFRYTISIERTNHEICCGLRSKYMCRRRRVERDRGDKKRSLRRIALFFIGPLKHAAASYHRPKQNELNYHYEATIKISAHEISAASYLGGFSGLSLVFVRPGNLLLVWMFAYFVRQTRCG